MPFPASSFARTGRFSEIYPVGRGAVGQVYAALDNLGRRVAVKEALPAAEGFAAFRGKFAKESRLQAALDHPNIVRVHHLEEDPETRELYLISEYADGGSLAELIEREGPLPEARAIALALDICAALEETERLRIVHRDVKPSNILLFTQPDGGLTAKLGDFGIAQDTRQRKTTLLPGAGHPGTPLYMAPEQADVTLLLDSRADIFALGVTLWEMLTGEDYKALLRDGAGPTLQSYSPAAGPGIARVIARAVRADREERYQTPRELAEDLRRVQQGGRPAAPPVRARPPARRAAPLALAGGPGPRATTAVLLFGVALAIPGLVSLLVGGSGPAQALVGSMRPTVEPPPVTPTSTPIAEWTATALAAAQQVATPTATPVAAPNPPAAFGQTSVVATALAAPLPFDPSQLTTVPCQPASGSVATETRSVAPFTSLAIFGTARLEIRQGPQDSLQVMGDTALLPLIMTAEEDGRLTLAQPGCVSGTEGPAYILTVRDLRELTFDGSVSGVLEGIDAESLALTLRGNSSLIASGTVARLTIAIDGVGEVRAEALQSAAASVEIDGAGSVSVAASDSLDVGIAGVGSVIYRGDPTITRSISGVGSVEQAPGP